MMRTYNGKNYKKKKEISTPNKYEDSEKRQISIYDKNQPMSCFWSKNIIKA